MVNAHRITVGDAICISLHEGGGTSDLEGIKGRFPDVSESDLIAALDGQTETLGSLNCLYIDLNGTKILADVGFGIARRPDLGNVDLALQSVGVQPADIDIVYLTHFHGDHIAGLLTPEGNPTYPNARYVTSNAEWQEWIPRWEASEQEYHKQLLNMMTSLEDKFAFVDDGDEVIAGVTVVLIPGHTLGQTGLLVESNGERFIHVADLLHQTFQFAHTDWHFAFDSDGTMASKTRADMLERCATENLLAMFYHLPFPGIGHVKKDGAVYQWQAIEI
ncbi:MAG: MBL fold metallo-hydrolase [Anaerolineae bacterium]|nr:MBL fold metallo-hydrolase [Anaerolineae bacterium]